MGYKQTVTQREYQKEWARKRRVAGRKFIQDYKIQQGCFDCGYKEHHAGLEFDHLSDKKYNIASMVSHTQESVMKEVAKCQVVCGTCHNIRTWKRRQAPID